MSATPPLSDLLARAFDARGPLFETLHTEQTDTYRLFHGSAEGAPGLTVDRYGDLLLVQTFHEPVTEAQRLEIEAFYAERFPGAPCVWNDRSRPHSRVLNRLPAELLAQAQAPRVVRELGVNYRFRARHAGQDPWLFLDMRAGPRRIQQEAKGRSFLNLFSYTGSVGVCAALAGATRSLNIDFASSALEVGKENAALNGVTESIEFLKSDVFPALRQLSGLGQSRRVRGKLLPPYPKLDAEDFDLVFLDPPRYAKGPFGVVDTVHDYQALLKPALLCTAVDGALYCTNNAAQVGREEWRTLVERCAEKAGRPVRGWEWIGPEADFPSFDGQPPLKMARLQL